MRQAALAGLSNVPKWKAPGPAFNAKAVMAGKSILSIPGSDTDPFYVQIENGMRQAAAAVGYKFTTWNNQGQLSQYQQGIATGVTKKASLIDLLAGPDPQHPEAADRRRQGGRRSWSSPRTSPAFEQKVPNVSSNLPQDYTGAGRLLADWVIATTPRPTCWS